MARSFQKPLPPMEPGASPVNPVPSVVILLVLLIAGVEVVLSLGQTGAVGGPAAIGWRVALIERLAFSPAVWDYAVEGRQRDPGLLLRFVSYAFVHGGAMHALFGAALLLALGKFVAEGMGGLATLAVFLVGTVGGAVVFALFVEGTQPLFGCYPGVYGLIGGFTYLLWLRLGRAGENRLQAFRLIGGLLAIQLVFGLLFGGSPTWVADVGGFLVGGLAAVPLAPGGIAALQARLRAR